MQTRRIWLLLTGVRVSRDKVLDIVIQFNLKFFIQLNVVSHFLCFYRKAAHRCVFHATLRVLNIADYRHDQQHKEELMSAWCKQHAFSRSEMREKNTNYEEHRRGRKFIIVLCLHLGLES